MALATAKLAGFYAAAFGLAVAASFATISLPSLLNLPGNAKYQLWWLLLVLLGASAVFQLAFGLMTGIGRSLIFWPVAFLVMASSIAAAWLISGTSLGKAAPLDPAIPETYGQEFLNSVQRATVFMVIAVALMFVLGLVAAIIAMRRSGGAP